MIIYVDFAKTTSWKLNSEYEPLPTAMREELQAFFAPHNEMLFELIQENISDEDW
jgi:hypothetical protein